MRKECYGLIVPTDGEIKYLYEDPYNYIESIGCKPIDDYLGTLEDIDEENGPIRNPSYILGNNNNNFNILFYSKDGLKSKDKINNIINAFCNAFMYGTKFDNLILDMLLDKFKKSGMSGIIKIVVILGFFFFAFIAAFICGILA